MHLTAELSLYVIIVLPRIANYRFKILILFQFYLLKYFIHDKITYRVKKVNHSLPFCRQIGGGWQPAKAPGTKTLSRGFEAGSFTLCFVDR